MTNEPIFKDYTFLIRPKGAEEAEIHMLPISPILTLIGLNHPMLKGKPPEEVMAETFIAMINELDKEFEFYTGEYE